MRRVAATDRGSNRDIYDALEHEYLGCFDCALLVGRRFHTAHYRTTSTPRDISTSVLRRDSPPQFFYPTHELGVYADTIGGRLADDY
jgi:hypothetical protein